MDNYLVIKISIIWGKNSGKTNFMNYLIEKDFDINAYNPSLSTDFYTKKIKFHEQTIKLYIFGTSRRELYEPQIKSFNRQSSLIFYFIIHPINYLLKEYKYYLINQRKFVMF